MTTLALCQTMLEQGASKNTVNMEWDKIWAYNKKAIDNIAPRFMAVVEETAVILNFDNFEGGDKVVCGSKPLHDKNPDLGNKAIQYAKRVYIERGDAKELKVGEKITLKNWGNAVITKCDLSGSDYVLHADLKLDDTDYKGTSKITWVAVDEATNYRFTMVEYDHLITEKKVDDNTKVQDCVNRNSKFAYTAIGEGAMRNLKKGQHIQIERRGYFFVDSIARDKDLMTLHYVPDGKQSAMSKIDGNVIDAKKAMTGNTTKKEEKKEKPAADGEEKKLSKKELNKLKKKENKTAKKEGGDNQI